MTPEEIDALWRDPRNYKYGVYFCKEDPRAIVPRRIKWMGWTANFARPSAIPITLFLLAVLAVPTLIARQHAATSAAVVLTFIASVIVMCLLCVCFASTTRWKR